MHMDWEHSHYIWAKESIRPTIGSIVNVEVCVIICRVLPRAANGKHKRYLEIQDGICYGVDTNDTKKYVVRMLDDQQMESHSPDFIIPMNGRTPEETHTHILEHLLAFLYPVSGHDCGLCLLWVRNVHSCHFLEPLFISSACLEHIHFNIRRRLIKKS